MRSASACAVGAILGLAVIAVACVELAASLPIGAVWHSAAGPLVNVSCGTVRGVYINMPNGTVIAGFRGIPFAAPPARWQQPLPFDGVCGTPDAPYDGTYERPTCVQPDNTGSEDCLFVNVYTTVSARPNSNSSVPVLAYIHGGGLMWGTSNGMDFTQFMSFGAEGAVVVTIAYRLNIFGFLAVSELTAEQGGASGNYGLMDLQLGLRWVQANAGQFGGDAGRVTVAGQSSGGTAIFALLASPGSRGLFSRAISLSGSPNISISLAAAEAQNGGIVSAAKCGSAPSPAARLQCMRAAPIATLTAAIPDSWNTPGMWNLPTSPNGMNYAGLPVVEGRVLTCGFEEALRTGLVDVPLMFGNMGYEPDAGPEQVVKGYTAAQWTDFVSSKMAAFGSAAVSKMLGLYANESATDPQKAYDAIVSDYGLTCATVKLMHSAQGPGGAYRSNIYVFVNNWGPAVPIATPNPNYFVDYAYHTWDLTNVLGSYGLYAPQPSDLQHSAYLMDWWHQFMANGSLDASSGWLPVASSPQWPEVASLFVIAPEGPQLVPGYRADQCAFMDSIGIDERFWWCD